MAVHPGRGDPIPGFDSETGEAVSYTAAEWRYRIKGLKPVFDSFTDSVRVYDGDKLRYEIFACRADLL